jgi:glycosyltransferase involved in cell wall biosynthesis
MSSLISIIIPAYNQAAFVTACVESMLAQTHNEKEIIVVDDGSTDDTERVLAPYAQQIHLIRQQNQGVSAARNNGFAASHGKFVLFIDADDYADRQQLESLLRLLENNPGAGAAFSSYAYVDADNRLLRKLFLRGSRQPLKDLLSRNLQLPSTGGVLIRREVFERVGGFDTSMSPAADFDLWLRIAQFGYDFECASDVLFYYRIQPLSMSSRVDRMEDDLMRSLDKVFESSERDAETEQLKSLSYARTHLENAARYIRTEDIRSAVDRMQQAVRLKTHATSSIDAMLNWIAHSARDPRTPDATRFIERVFEHLPDEAQQLRMYKSRALGMYHTISLFEADQMKQSIKARQHIFPAIIRNPSNWRNKGFWRICLRAMLA